MRWSWEVEPHGIFRLMAPLIGHMGRGQEETIWAGLKRYLEALERSVPPRPEGHQAPSQGKQER